MNRIPSLLRKTLWTTLFLAPVPPYRPPVPASVVGTWKMTWRSQIYAPTTFYKDGHYECGLWEGSWKREGEKLTITESLKGSESPPIEWKVQLTPGKLQGVFEGSQNSFSLTTMEPDLQGVGPTSLE